MFVESCKTVIMVSAVRLVFFLAHTRFGQEDQEGRLHEIVDEEELECGSMQNGMWKGLVESVKGEIGGGSEVDVCWWELTRVQSCGMACIERAGVRLYRTY